MLNVSMHELPDTQAGEGVLPRRGYIYGKAPPKRGTFSRLQVYQKVWISTVYVFDRVGKFVI